MAICKYCKKEFVPKKRSAGKYCSIECCRADFKENGRPDPRSHKEAVCDWCGKVYQPKKWDTRSELHYCSNKCQWQSMRRHPDVICPICKKKFQASDDRKKYCSWDCMHKAQRKYASKAEAKTAEKAKRRAIIKDAIVDHDITLKKLFERDKGICYICGQPCSWRDCYRVKSGAMICCDQYPSIDHVTPLSKGGKHSWANVRLAHMHCNIAKCAKLTHETENGQLMFWI